MLRRGLKRDLLILLGALADEFENQSVRYQLWRISTLENYKSSTFYSTISNLLSVGEIEKIEKKGEVFYQITSRGSERLKESIPVFKLAKKVWDGYWRIVIFDIKGKNRVARDILRKKLFSLGFGRWQKSVYITPHNIEQEINQYLESHKLRNYCICLVAKRSDMGDDKLLAEKVWQLEKLNEEYEELIFDCQKLEKEKFGIEKLSKIWERYKELILKDPHLPKQLLPEGWKAQEAKKKVYNLYTTINDRIPFYKNE